MKGDVLGESTYPPERLTYVASFPGVDLVCDRRLMFDRPSELPADLLGAAAGRRVILHAIHSVSDWLAFAVWQEGRLRRSLSLSPDGGIVENIGDPSPFEMPYWAGDRPVEFDPAWDEEPYALPFHPLELGNEALRALFGFLLKGRPSPEDVGPDEVPLLGFDLTDLDTSRRAQKRAALEEAARRMQRKSLHLGADRSWIEALGGQLVRARRPLQPRCLPGVGGTALLHVPPLMGLSEVEESLDHCEVCLRLKAEYGGAIERRRGRFGPERVRVPRRASQRGARPVYARQVGASLPAQPPWE
ncbi:DUF6928 family protein [Streptomyces sindenensis]|uniref:DUF6928 family protein n=1 Tax=Streptomyces sindenensis TaxID=67363 RepID=UPI0019AFCCAC|nr:hypothetical protein [Streptomyces sindenensis]GGP87358.1 hypothetical protein GCM10010231_66640 [Streptomyces sindenensis]